MTENTVKSHVRRLRQRFTRYLREEIAQTVTCEADVDDEVRSLITVFSG